VPTDDACRLAAAVGRDVRCAEALCAYWEAAEDRSGMNGCGLRRLAPYLSLQPELARQLLALRARLEDVRPP
jgi:hypothetical protein